MSGGVRNPPPGSINFHLHTLASSLFKGSTRYYGAKFGIGLPEMRILSNLGREGRLPAHQLVALTAMDKAIVSRVLAALGRRGHVSHSEAAGDLRRRTWQLTPSGQRLVDRLRPEWQRREAIIQADLAPQERELLVDMLIRMFKASERLREVESQQLAEPRRDSPMASSASDRGPASP
jgi:DNA-binding MarR family transcriptional regulator